MKLRRRLLHSGRVAMLGAWLGTAACGAPELGARAGAPVAPPRSEPAQQPATPATAGSSDPSDPVHRAAHDQTSEPALASTAAGKAVADAALAIPAPAPSLRRPTEWMADYHWSAAERVAQAKRAKLGVVQQLFRDSEVAFPPAELLLRGFKREAQLEIWASSRAGGPMAHVTTYEICALSGELGPKRREGDGQVPEGYYRIAYLWPLSSFHLSMNIGYPNRSDRILGGRQPGSAIMIHGNCASIGCLAMSDERIQELWLMVSAVHYRGQRVHVHLYPTRRLEELLADETYREHRPFWRNLLEGYQLFEQHRRLPQVRVDWQGRYGLTLPTVEPD